MGIELKTKHVKGLQTLFSKVPTDYVGCENKRGLIENYGYYDTVKARQALYTSINSKGDSLGFSLRGNNDSIRVMKGNQEVLLYDCDALEETLLSKHSETAYISVIKHKDGAGKEQCQYEQMLYCKRPSMRRFLKLLKAGNINLDFLLSIRNNKISDKGFLWKIKSDAIPDLYLVSESIDLGSAR